MTGIRRRGKYLLFDLHDPDTCPRELIVHLGMTGRLAVTAATDVDRDHPHLRAWWQLDTGALLTFHDARRFGRIHVVDPGHHAAIPTLAALGPEPFDPAFDGRHVARFVARSNRHLKTLLLGQRMVAGVGNIYADEALWMAGINPATRRLSRARADRLVDTVRVALQSGLDHGGTTLRDYVDSDGATGGNQHELHCYGRAGSPCERCGAELRRRDLDARSTTWCPRCQAR
ncbi:MAG: bifunctional DNA-formamidopyrimidine glycosylase/DNA-(apurinic or apyrimidinic site) lyase [Acidimicrobiales bacterium]